MRTYAELDQDMSRLSRDAGNINAWMRSYTPEKRDELTLLAQQQQQVSLALDACIVEKNLLDILKREQELKDFLQKQEQQIKELRQKEEFQKADAAEKERQSKELAAKQDRDKQELLQKQERDKQENEKQEALNKQELQAQEAQLKEMMQKEKELADANARKQESPAPQQENLAAQTLANATSAPQENLISETVKDTLYSTGQAAEAVLEAAKLAWDAYKASQASQSPANPTSASPPPPPPPLPPAPPLLPPSAPANPAPQAPPNPAPPPQENIVSEIIKETVYSAGQAIDAVKEAAELAAEHLRAIKEKETEQFVEEQRKQLGEFMTTQSFQAAPGENKEIWLAEKFKEQNRAEEEKFVDRPDPKGLRAEMLDDLKALQDGAMELARREQALEKATLRKIDEAKDAEAKAKERIEQSSREQAVIDHKLKELAEASAKLQEAIRQEAEKARQAMCEKWLQEQRMLEEQRQRDALRGAMAFTFH